MQEDLNNLKEHIEKIGVAALGVVDKEAKASALVSSRKRNSWLLFFMAWTLVVSGFVLALAHFKEYVPYLIVYSDSCTAVGARYCRYYRGYIQIFKISVFFVQGAAFFRVIQVHGHRDAQSSRVHAIVLVLTSSVNV